MKCPHGDPFCPCQDGDSCHYERTADTVAWPCPTMPPGRRFGPHCHVEGCEWGPGSVGSIDGPRSSTANECGLLRIAPESMDLVAMGCGMARNQD